MNLLKHTDQQRSQKNAFAHKPAFFQPKLTVNQPNDIYEQEADATADRVMGIQSNSVNNNAFFKPADNNVQRKCQHCEEEEKLHRKETSDDKVQGNNELDSYVGSLGSSGQSLPNSSRQFFESRFGHDFSNVRIHNDSVAAKSAQSINALAYTSGNNIVFNSGQYSPESESGKRLMAHELTHVVQQSGNIQPKLIQRKLDVDPTAASSCTIHFKQGSAEFTDAKEFARCMQVIKDYLKTGNDAQVALHGFASEEGDAGYNLELSKKRSQKVLSLLKAGKTDTSHITIEGHGEDTTYPSREANRRVEVVDYREINMPEEHIEGKPPCPATYTIPEDVHKAIGEAWDKSGHGGDTVQEHGGRIVTDKDGKNVIRTGDGGSGSISLPAEQAGDTTLGTFHTHPYSKSEGSTIGVSFSGGDINNFVSGGQGSVKYIGAGTCDFVLNTTDMAARDKCKTEDLPKRWNDTFATASGTFQEKVETAVKATIKNCGLCYYKACRPDDKSPIPKDAHLS